MVQNGEEDRHESDTGDSTNGWNARKWLLPILILGAVAGLWQAGIFSEPVAPPPAVDSSQDEAPSPAAKPSSAASSPKPEEETDQAKNPRTLADQANVQVAGSKSWDELDDPNSDGWQTEVLNAAVNKKLKKLGGLITQPNSLPPNKLSALVAENFACGPLRPTELTTAFQDTAIIVERGTPSAAESPYRGPSGLIEAFARLAPGLHNAEDARFKFKVIHVGPTKTSVKTTQLLTVSGTTPDGFLEQHATWDAVWNLSDSGQAKLASIRVTKFEQSRAATPATALFADCTESALSGTACYEPQILRGLNHWLEQLPLRTILDIYSLPGVAVADVNGDGLEDLYLCQDAGLPNRLFLQNDDGTAREVSREWKVDWLENCRGALLVDLDNDGDQDLVVAVRGRLVLAANDEQKGFKVRAVLKPREDVTSLTAADYDGDGRLDIYVCAYAPVESKQLQSMGAATSTGNFSLHDANDGSPNTLFRNVTEPGRRWKFEDVTEDVGLNAFNQRWSFAAAWEDYDNDGDPDLYVVNDYGRDNLYRNDLRGDGKRVFTDVSDAARIEDSANGMGITWGDFDRDGWVDHYVSNMWSSAGLRVTSQQQFQAGSDDTTRQRYRHVAEGNTLMRNRGNGVFENRSTSDGVALGRWAWGTRFFDLNNDGWQDLVVANGYITTDDTGDL